MLHSECIACVMQMYRTYSADEYDRRNEFVNPLAAQAEYELEKRVDQLDQFNVELDKSKSGVFVLLTVINSLRNN
jgi:hypothetical protein